MTGLRLTIRDDEAGRLPKWRLILVAVVVAILAGGLSPASPAQAAFPGRNGLIAFSRGAGGGDIYTVKPDGSSLRRLTLSGNNWAPKWSPDGKKIAFVSSRSGNPDIHVMNANGSGVTQVTRHASQDTDPTWSPDGKRLAFTSDRNKGRHIFTIGATAPFGVPKQVSFQSTDPTYEVYEWEPAWSPGGSVILASHLWSPEHNSRGSAYGIVGFYANGSGRVPGLYINGVGDSLSPSYAPRGRKVAYIASQDRYLGLALNVYKANPDGTNVVALTHSDDSGGPTYRYPTWSPDGNSLVVNQEDQNTATPEGLYIMRADGTGLRWLTDGTRADWQPIPL